MKRTIAIMTAVALAVSTFASMAFIVPSEVSSTKQAKLVSVLPVEVKETNPGVRTYAPIVDTTRIYQANELITVASVLEVANRAQNPTLASIEGASLDLVVNSTTIDFSYGQLAPSFIYDLVGANNWNAQSIASAATAITGGIAYDVASGAVKLAMKGVKSDKFYNLQTGAEEPTSTTGNRPGWEINQGLNGRPSFGMYQAYQPFMQTNDRVMIPALNSTTMEVGTPAVKYTAPSAVQYTLILTGITKTATKGDMEAKLLVSGKEEFTAVGAAADNGINYEYLNVGGVYTVVREYAKGTMLNWTPGVGVPNPTHTYAGNLGVIANRYYNTGATITNPYNVSRLTSDLAYRGVNGSIEIFHIYKYSKDDSVNLNGQSLGVNAKNDDYLVGMATEHSENPVVAIKGLGYVNSANTEVIRKQDGFYEGVANAAPITDITAYATQIDAELLKRQAGIPAEAFVTPARYTAFTFTAVAGTNPTATSIEFEVPAALKTSAVVRIRTATTPSTAVAGTYYDVNDGTAVTPGAATPAILVGTIDSNVALNSGALDATDLAAAQALGKITLPVITNVPTNKMQKSDDAISAVNFFKLYDSVTYTSGVAKANFEAAGAPATYSDVVTNTYNYGTITIIEDEVDEPTEEEVIEDEEELDVEEEEEVPEVEEVVETPEEVTVPKTGDFSASVAIALIASAIVAAAALAFVTKKVR